MFLKNTDRNEMVSVKVLRILKYIYYLCIGKTNLLFPIEIIALDV